MQPIKCNNETRVCAGEVYTSQSMIEKKTQHYSNSLDLFIIFPIQALFLSDPQPVSTFNIQPYTSRLGTAYPPPRPGVQVSTRGKGILVQLCINTHRVLYILYTSPLISSRFATFSLGLLTNYTSSPFATPTVLSHFTLHTSPFTLHPSPFTILIS